MKPSISSAFFKSLNPYEMVEVMQECGYNQTEINEEHFKPFYRDLDVNEYRRFIDDRGFSIPQGHLVFMNEGNITSIDNTYAIDNLKRNLEVFEKLGVKAAVLHYSNFGTDWVPWEEWFDVRVDALRQLTDFIKGTDMVICLENLSRLYDFDAGHLLRLCKAVNNEHIGICLDTGHLNISKRGNQYDFIMQAGKYLKAMHVHENYGEHDGLIGVQCDLYLPPFSSGGNVNFEDVRRGVKDLNYQGLFSYELTGTAAPIEVKKIQAKALLEIYNTYVAFEIYNNSAAADICRG
ncbi:MAG: sugar phosphate isomerase/epimerase family protein [Clostridia bacterium]|nr:sugar phosphate isomerase/epimerase family protein [Clostridia bacterium]